MRQVFCEPLARWVSVLGFGCASLGSRISPRQGIRAVQLAFDLGVRWFDVAPPYGDGQAERHLGEFLRNRRDEVVVCTKVGIGRPNVSRVKQAARVLARPAVKAFPLVRGPLARMRGAVGRKPINATEIEESVLQSLTALNTDYIDILALHEPVPTEATDPAVHAVLKNLLDRGIVKGLSIAGGEAAISAGFNSWSGFKFAQFADSPFHGTIDRIRPLLDQRPAVPVTHSVLGSGNLSRFDRLTQHENGAELLLEFAFAKNPDGVVLMSMFSEKNIRLNCAQAAQAVRAEAIGEVRAAIGKCDS